MMQGGRVVYCLFDLNRSDDLLGNFSPRRLGQKKFRYYYVIKNLLVYNAVIAEFWIGQIVVEISFPEGQSALNNNFKNPNLARA
mgnify:CR=1 FL=1